MLELCPDSVHLRASWMYDLPGYGLPIRGNLPLNLLRAALKGEALRFSRNDPRRDLCAAGNRKSGACHGAARRRIQFWQRQCRKHGMHRPAVCRNAGNTVKIEEESWERNLVMDAAKLERSGIRFRHHAAGHPALLQRITDFEICKISISHKNQIKQNKKQEFCAKFFRPKRKKRTKRPAFCVSQRETAVHEKVILNLQGYAVLL